MCKYCEGNNDDRITLNESEHDDLRLKIYEYYFLDKVTIADGYSGEDSIPINYCPMCGREL